MHGVRFRVHGSGFRSLGFIVSLCRGRKCWMYCFGTWSLRFARLQDFSPGQEDLLSSLTLGMTRSILWLVGVASIPTNPFVVISLQFHPKPYGLNPFITKSAWSP